MARAGPPHREERRRRAAAVRAQRAQKGVEPSAALQAERGQQVDTERRERIDRQLDGAAGRAEQPADDGAKLRVPHPTTRLAHGGSLAFRAATGCLAATARDGVSGRVERGGDLGRHRGHGSLSGGVDSQLRERAVDVDIASEHRGVRLGNGPHLSLAHRAAHLCDPQRDLCGAVRRALRRAPSLRATAQALRDLGGQGDEHGDCGAESDQARVFRLSRHNAVPVARLQQQYRGQERRPDRAEEGVEAAAAERERCEDDLKHTAGAREHSDRRPPVQGVRSLEECQLRRSYHVFREQLEGRNRVHRAEDR
mmetsp:Transcript_37278/g.119555  ORF Transcript_37278/g.119555 Transcript_37278/m.119555 type:complete len:310 (+) Transcript_37278:591-1520(+)